MLETKLRPQIHRWSTQTFLSLWIIWMTICCSIKCSPFENERLRQRRDVYPEIQQEEKAILIENEAVCVVGDLVYARGDSVPAAEQSCLRCKCQPPEVACETVRCEKKAGCRAIHKPNTCCPEYKCDCEYNGRMYSNGERLETEPGGECRVCYCHGGEVQCAKVTCYIRPDCEGRKVDGKCCPKYDHCPPREPYLERGHFITTSKYEDTTTMPVSQSKNSTSLDLIGYALTSDKSDNLVIQNEIAELVPSCEDIAVPSEMMPQPEHDMQSGIHIPKITIQEIIPEMKEFAITSSPKRDIGSTKSGNVHGQLLVEETFAIEDNSDKSNGLDDAEDSNVESSEIAEIYQQPPVLRIGDKLLFLKQGELVHEKDVSTPKTIITIIGAEGLQRGFEESFETKDVTNNSTSIDTPRQAKDASRALETSGDANFEVLNEAESGSIFGHTEYDNSTIVEAGEVPEANITVNQNMTIDEESTSKRIITMLKEIVNDSSSSTGKSSETTEIFDLSTEVTTEARYNSSPINLSMLVDIELPPIDYDFNSTTFNSTVDWIEVKLDSSDLTEVSTVFNNQSSTVIVHSTKESDREEMDNPEYPPIPDIMTSQNLDVENLDDVNATTITAESVLGGSLKILPEVLANRSNKTVDSTNGTTNEWLKSTETVYNKDAIIPDAILKQIAPSDANNSNTTITDDGSTSLTSADFFNNQLRQLASIDGTADTLVVSPEQIRDVESMEVLDVNNSTSDNTEAITDKSTVLETMSSEDASISNMDDVEVMNGTMNITHQEFTTTVVVPEDVELLTTTAKTLEKRQENENDKIFEELNHEIKLEDGTAVVNKSKHEEQKEAETIFKELLEETGTTTKSPSVSSLQSKNGAPQPRDRESAVLQRVSNAIAKFQLRDTKQSLDTSILSILRDFFSSQYRSYNRK